MTQPMADEQRYGHQPISAPPYDREGIDADAEAVEREEGYSSADTHRDHYARAAEFQQAKAVATAPVPARVIMRVSNRYNWQHFYTMPADVGYQNVPGLIRSMQAEGCKLTDIQITFEVQEMK